MKIAQITFCIHTSHFHLWIIILIVIKFKVSQSASSVSKWIFGIFLNLFNFLVINNNFYSSIILLMLSVSMIPKSHSAELKWTCIMGTGSCYINYLTNVNTYRFCYVCNIKSGNFISSENIVITPPRHAVGKSNEDVKNVDFSGITVANLIHQPPKLPNLGIFQKVVSV